jgi:hypothetical protein
MKKLRPYHIVFILALAFFSTKRGHANAPTGHYNITDDTVYDTKTKLTWQREFPGEGFTWSEARSYCVNLDLQGTGWRLPSMKELQTIVDDKTTMPSIDGAAFPNTPWGFFWTSSSYVDDPSLAWFVEFESGRTYYDPKDAAWNLRCVR